MILPPFNLSACTVATLEDIRQFLRDPDRGELLPRAFRIDGIRPLDALLVNLLTVFDPVARAQVRPVEDPEVFTDEDEASVIFDPDHDQDATVEDATEWAFGLAERPRAIDIALAAYDKFPAHLRPWTRADFEEVLEATFRARALREAEEDGDAAEIWDPLTDPDFGRRG